jgi:hypothetical protein
MKPVLAFKKWLKYVKISFFGYIFNMCHRKDGRIFVI